MLSSRLISGWMGFIMGIGFALGLLFWLNNIEGPSCDELSERLTAWRHCIRDGPGCRRSPKFYEHYHFAKRAYKFECMRVKIDE